MTDENTNLTQPKKSKFTKIRSWYARYERPISSLSLIGGFVFDALTLKRVDLFWENFWVIAHLVIVGTCIVLVHAFEKSEGAETDSGKLHFWLVNIMQFFYGGIFSTFLVFYFRSGDIAVSWPFILLLVICFWANESLKRHFVRLSFQISLFFLSVFSFAIFLVPVLLHKIGTGVFLLSGGLSLVFIALFLKLIQYTSKKEFQESKTIVYGGIAGIFVLVNVFYFTHIIPPIPLSLKDAGVYHSLYRNAQGNYVVAAETEGFKDFFNLYPDYHTVPGEAVYVYTAVFSPPSLNENIVHQWQHQDAKTGKWSTVDVIPLVVVGGRDGGFRTYSEKTFNVAAGHWRVNVLTAGGQVIGRVRFNIVIVNAPPVVTQKINS